MINIIILTTLVALTAFFVASEFSIVKLKQLSLDELVADGNKRAFAAKKVITNLDDYLAACQLGITMTALGIGWLGGPVIAAFFSPFFGWAALPPSIVSILSIGFSFTIITFVHVVAGELVPKQIAIHKFEAIGLFIARPLVWFYRLTFPMIWALNYAARFITKLFGFKVISRNELAHSEEELRIILSESYKSGEINLSEFKYVNNIFEFDNRIAYEIMVPRTEIVSFNNDYTIEDFLQIIRDEKYTRYPIVDGDKDHVLGLVNVRELMADYIMNRDVGDEKISAYIRPIIKMIDTIPIKRLLIKMQKESIHMAILMDEYGGTSGLVTVEDIIEEIVGEIRDEFDSDEVPAIQRINENHYLIDSKVLVHEVNELLSLQLDDDDVNTIGGWILTKNYLAEQGDIVTYDDFIFKVIEKKDNHIKLIEIKK